MRSKPSFIPLVSLACVLHKPIQRIPTAPKMSEHFMLKEKILARNLQMAFFTPLAPSGFISLLFSFILGKMRSYLLGGACRHGCLEFPNTIPALLLQRKGFTALLLQPRNP